MVNVSTAIWLYMLLFLLLLAGGVFLEIFLAKRENRWLGLILPALSLMYALLMVCSIVVTDGMTAWDIFSLIGGTFLVCNIPTLVLLVIYAACRENMRRKKQLERMQIKDLDSN